LPTCADYEGLGVTQGGTLVCKPVPTSPTLPVCASDQALSSAGGAFVCGQQVSGGPDLSEYMTRAANVVSGVASAEMTVAQLRATVGPPAVFVGNTVTTTIGKISAAGNDTGLNSANALCSSTFMSSHLCTAYEMYRSIVQGVLTSAKPVPPAFIYFPTGSGNFSATVDSANMGLEDNCGSYTYPTSDRGWRGAAAEWGMLPSGAVGLMLHGSAEATCHSIFPLACCL
jgi:hypothetical protein